MPPQCYYYAYGSNMSPAKLQDWDVAAEFISIACLQGWRFRMNKRGRDGYARANIEPAAGTAVWGVLYRVDAEGIRKLDKMEGLGKGYKAEFLPVRTPELAVYEAYTYIGIRLAEGLPVHTAYRDMILDGAAHYQLPDTYTAWLTRQFSDTLSLGE